MIPGGSLAFRKPATRPSDLKSLPSSGGQKWSLGSTQGLFAAGAWAARQEIVRLLEARCDPSEVTRLVRSGEEGEHRLVAGEDPTSASELEPAEPSELDASPSSPKANLQNLLGGDDLTKQIAEHQNLLEKLAAGRDDPPWAKPAGSGASRTVQYGAKEGPKDLVFRKQAAPPSQDVLERSRLSEFKRSTSETPTEDLEAIQSFRKRAMPPTAEELKAAAEKKPKTNRFAGAEARHGSMKERESKDLKTFHNFAMRIFESLKKLEVVMDLEELVVKDGSIDEDRFFTHTCPNRASTGLRYARCMQTFLKWVLTIPESERKVTPNAANVAKLRVVEYLEFVIQVGVGFSTPYTVLYALDFFGKAFGFSVEGNLWDRCRRLANRYSNLKPTDVNRAPPFRKDFLAALERIVLDTTRTDAERVVCGKLRLCTQASVRYDDILHTPLSSCQWIRKRGETSVVGLRSVSTQGKHHARYWVASLMGVVPEHDEWLLTLMDLILTSHGTNWRHDDHTGKMPDFELDGFTSYPARLENDVTAIRTTLLRQRGAGNFIGMSADEVKDLRWHGAKSTFSSLMQHLSVDTKVVRLAGGWTSRDENMPDTYLREAQIMVLGAQEKVLDYIRKGGDLEKFESTPLDHPPKKGETSYTGEQKEAPVVEAMEPFSGKHHSRCREELLDEAFDSGGRPNFEKVQLEANIKIELDKLDELVGQAAEPLEMVPEIPKFSPTDEDSDAPTSPAELEDAEGLVSSFVMVDRPTTISKLHLGKETLSAVHGYVMLAAPKCGAVGSFAVVGAGEKIDEETELCARCFGKNNSCRKLCDFTVTTPENTLLRCGRICGATTVCTGPHRCLIHTEE